MNFAISIGFRNSRRTNWGAVNRTRMLGDFMYMLGVPKWAVQQARYCLRLRVCSKCCYDELKCYALCGRARRGDFDQGSLALLTSSKNNLNKYFIDDVSAWLQRYTYEMITTGK